LSIKNIGLKVLSTCQTLMLTSAIWRKLCKALVLLKLETFFNIQRPETVMKIHPCDQTKRFW